MCAFEPQKLRHDRTELCTRALQPALWLLIFGQTLTRIRVIPAGGILYVDYRQAPRHADSAHPTTWPPTSRPCWAVRPVDLHPGK
jgi:hypothetical protein